MRRPPNGNDRPLERLVGLQADDHLVVAIDIAGGVREQGRGRLRVDGENALCSLLFEVGLQLFPDRFRALGGAGEEALVALVGRHVADDEISHVDRLAPIAGLEPSPIIPFPDTLKIQLSPAWRTPEATLLFFGSVSGLE